MSREVGDPCAFPGDADVCLDNLLCGCVIEAGFCRGNFLCGSFCQGSFTGNLGSGCDTDEACVYTLQDSANEHLCTVNDAIGNKLSGEACDEGAECRSGRCAEPCAGCAPICLDFCDHHEPDGDGSCAEDSVCYLLAGRTSPPRPRDTMYAVCTWASETGSGITGTDCRADPNVCMWGPNSCVGGVCSEPCRLTEHCPADYHCSLEGPVNGNEVVPVCVRNDPAGDHNRQGGAACARNSQCISNFCQQDEQICLDMCTEDASCPPGLACENVYVEIPGTRTTTFVRMCLSEIDVANNPDNPYTRMP